MTLSYDDYVANKIIEAKPVGFEVGALNPQLFPYQADIVRWALRRGRAALFEYPGLGKSIQEWEFARHVCAHTDMPTILFAPLSVAEQMAMEGPDFGYDINICKTRADVRSGINVANYERLHHFSPEDFGGIILDESSILKAASFGATAKAINDFASTIPFRLAGSATPAPNNQQEILYHAEVLGIMREKEALALFFIQDGNTSNQYRLKMNAVDHYYKWLASWAVAIRKPSDLGYSDEGFIRPPVNWQQITIDIADPLDTGMLVQVEALGLNEQRKARNATLEQRVKATADLVNANNEQWLVWCELNDESAALAKAIPDAVEVTGSDSEAHKIDAMVGFKSGKYRVVVSKASMWGFGLNFQQSWNMVFCGLGNSFEQYFQASKRQDRFGQQHTVNIWVVVSTADGAVVQNIKRKEREQDAMYDELIKHMAVHMDLGASKRDEMDLPANMPLQAPSWLAPTSSAPIHAPPWIDFDSVPFQWAEAPEVTIGAAVGDVLQECPRWLESVA
jgi:hypothetical protein